ncbi:myosin heavy chain, non-muscle isoform X2 [Ipomoea triloba]|uniref:myosin heavy chain, non-muscle isoform X2 n=1 Tax=Ipomoea triloba TaxID=35885 RepID=UPI00125D6B23|nr:myosin heavy chain, non-muscle isoform X2 [Ipomoea triloba]
MFKSARWRSEKGKIKAVFKLHFRATQVAGDALMISVVPADVGKPTVKSEKATIRDGSCCWENAVYETVKLYREPKSGKIHERIYNFVVGTGSSKSGVVGEASIDFSSYAEATKVSSVSLPLKNSKSGAVLHVSIQRIHDSFDQSIIQENETAKPDAEDRTLKAQISNEDMEASFREDSVDETPVNKNISLVSKLNGRRASSESDITLSSSECSSGLDTPRDLRMKNSNTCKDQTTVGVPAIEEHQRSRWEWMGASTLDGSTDDSSSTSREVNLRGSEEIPDDVEKLRSELVAVARQAEVSELELQTLRKQIVKESKRGQDLSREIVILKEDRDAFKEECEKLKASRRRLDDAKSKDELLDRGDVQALVHELRQELNYQKDLNANLQIQLEKTQDSNSELILAVRDLDELLEQKNKEIMNLSGKSEISDDAERLQSASSKHDINNDDDDDDDDEQKALEQLVRQHSDIKEAYLLEQKITDLQNELEIYRRDKDELEMQMEQLALDYEILKQENHDLLHRVEQSQLQEQLKMQYECSTSYATVSELEAQIEGLESELKKQSATVSELEAQIEGLENDLKKQSRESSDSLLTISSLESQAKSLEEELEKQAQGFEADLEALSRDKVEQEQRAIRAEEALRKTRWQNANTAERLQEEFKRLSVQMTSTFEANEKLAIKALAEASELRLQKTHLEEMLQTSSEELESVTEHYEARLHELTSQVNMMSGQIKQMQSEKSTLLENEKRHAGEKRDEMQLAKAEIEKLLESNKILSELANKRESLINELEEMKETIAEMELMLEQGNKERSHLENMLALMQEKAEESLNELNSITHLKDEKDMLVGKLQLEIGTLREQYNELKTRSSEDESEKDKLRKQVSQLKGDLKKKEDALNSLDKKLKDANNKLASTNGAKAASRNNKFASATQGLKEVNSLKDKVKLLEGQIKLKENALETSTNSFLEKEKDLQNKIEELEARLEQINQNTAIICEQNSEKVATEDLNLNPGMTETVNSENGLLEEEIRDSVSSTGDMNKLLNEVTLLREKNSLMEDELKEMQERYSEISLKFAEVEGERQQLVMKVRNLKNAKKGH